MFQRLILKVSNEQGINFGSTAPAQKILPRFKAEAGKAAPPPPAWRVKWETGSTWDGTHKKSSECPIPACHGSCRPCQD